MASDTHDFASSAAFLFLNEQVAAGVITSTVADAYKAKFAELYRLANNASERENDVLAKARDLRASVREEQIALEKARIRKEQLDAMNDSAEADRKRLQVTLAELESRETALSTELNELRMREAELGEDVAHMKKDNEALVQPALNALVAEISEARGEAARTVAQGESLLNSKREISGRIEEIQAQMSAASNTAAALKSELLKVRADPARYQKAVDATKEAIASVNEEAARLRALIAAREADLEEQGRAVEQVATVRRELDAKLVRYRGDIDARDNEVATVEKSLKSERMQQKDLMERRLDMQSEETDVRAGVRLAEAERDANEAAYERAKRELKRQMDMLNELQASIPSAHAAVAERSMDLTRLREEGRTFESTLGSLKREMDSLMLAFLKEEGVERKQREALQDLIELCTAAEGEKDRWHREEALALKQISSLKAQRDIKSRELAKLTAQRKTTVEASKMKELQLIDLTKQLGDINNRLRTFAAMYDVVKNERNSYANAIQAASQNIAEMRERIKILHNEVDILQNESNAKDKALAKERQAHAVAAVQRDALRVDANKCAVLYRERQTAVEAKIMVIDKLNTIINGLEREMLALKRQYETAVETRNFTGIQLIDRNDELCILYEKSNIHEKTLGEGERTLRVVSEELRALRISAAELERQMHVSCAAVQLMRRSGVNVGRRADRAVALPGDATWAEKILELQRALVMSRHVTEKLCADLENPTTKDRWVTLGGDDPDTETLKLRVAALEMRVNSAREELLEKDLVLEEISSLTDRLRTTAAESGIAAVAAVGAAGVIVPTATLAATASLRSSTAEAPGLSLAKQINDCQNKIKDVTRRMMAVVSELSMYQATAIKLSSEVSASAETLAAAEDAAARGLPPTVSAEQQWQAWLRAATMPQLTSDVSWIDPVKTTAEPRPNAYIPEGVGIPKPYGEFAPFRPADAAAARRYYRNPEPKEIEL